MYDRGELYVKENDKIIMVTTQKENGKKMVIAV